MANKWAIQNGNWSDGSIWNDGVVPTVYDDVWLNDCNVTTNQDVIIEIKSFSNLANSQLGISEGGSLYLRNGCYLTVNEDIHAKDLIIEEETANVLTFRKFYALTTQIWENSGTGRMHCNVYSRSGLSYNYNYTFNGDIETDENSIGMFLSSAYAGSVGYTTIRITGNIIHKGGMLARSLRGYSNSGFIVGNIIAYTQLFPGSWVDITTPITGNINLQYQESGIFNPRNVNHYGDLVAGEKVGLSLEYYKNYGTITTYNTSYNYLFSANGDTLINNLNDETDISIVMYITHNIPPQYDLNLTGNVKIKNKSFINSSSYKNCPFSRVIASENCRIFFGKPNSVFWAELIINNPEIFKFTWIDEAAANPNWQLFSYGNNAFNYPQESVVSQGVTYGMQNEYEGRLQLPAEGVVVKGVEYGNKVGTLEVIALSGATAQAENIAVVNLTEQEVNRVKNCATVSTVQKCFEDFKEE